MPSSYSAQYRSVSESSYVSVSYIAATKRTVSSNGGGKSLQQSVFSSTERSWVRTPNYREIVKTGGVLPDNPLSYERINNGHAYGGVVTYFASGPEGWTRTVYTDLGHNTYIPRVISDPWNASSHTSKLLKKAKSSEWLAPVFFAEAGKTADMVYKNAVRLTSMIVALRKGNFKRFVNMWHKSARVRLRSKRSFNRAAKQFGRRFGKNPREAAASAWLEYKYGWTPFVLDVYNAFETLSDLQDNNPKSKVGTVRSRLKKDVVETITSVDRLTSVAGIRVGGTITINYELSSRAVWRFTVNENLNTIGKVGLTNPLNVGWELVPLSFVADWFLPIGDYLAALDAPMRFSHVGGTIGYKCDAKAKSQVFGLPNFSVTPSTFKEGDKVSVTVRPMPGIPSMSLKDMTFLPNLEHGRAYSAIALLSQAFSGLQKR